MTYRDEELLKALVGSHEKLYLTSAEFHAWVDYTAVSLALTRDLVVGLAERATVMDAEKVKRAMVTPTVMVLNEFITAEEMSPGSAPAKTPRGGVSYVQPPGWAQVSDDD